MSSTTRSLPVFFQFADLPEVLVLGACDAPSECALTNRPFVPIGFVEAFALRANKNTALLYPFGEPAQEAFSGLSFFSFDLYHVSHLL